MVDGIDENAAVYADLTGNPGSGNGTGNQTETTAVADSAFGEKIKVAGTESIFNPFYVFRYSAYGAGTTANTSGKYDVAKHRPEYETARFRDIVAEAAKRSEQKKDADIQNPTATSIIEWTNAQGLSGGGHKGPLYPYPYSVSDFMACKWYGKMPNNRLITLRRYPIPVEDNLAISSAKLPLVPMAQAVTWWGGSTGNYLSNMLSFTYGYKWEDYPGVGQDEIQDVQGNEINFEQLLDAAGIQNESARQALIAAFGQADSPFAFSGYDKTLQENEKAQFEKGAYANRVRGPINVITQTKKRNRGFDFTNSIELTFEYNLRSIGGINPKIMMLDLISNFLSLTYSRASFWGGGYRYFQQTGPLLPGFNSDAMEKGDYAEAGKELLEMVNQMVQAGGDDLKKFLNGVANDAAGATSLQEGAEKVVGNFAKSKVGSALIASRLKNLHQTPLVMRALADGRAVGEWHVMIGNPMNPLAVIGNLCLSSTTMTFSEELGADDFPTSVKFVVTLVHGRPRAKQDIESIFNLGSGDLSFTALQPSSSEMNSFGEYNSTRANNALGNPQVGTPGSNADLVQSTDLADAQQLNRYFGRGVSNHYGPGFGNSPILTDYFTKLYTKD